MGIFKQIIIRVIRFTERQGIILHRLPLHIQRILELLAHTLGHLIAARFRNIVLVLRCHV